MTQENARDRRLLAASAGGFFLLTLVLGFLSDGVHHDDDLTHFLIARWARWFPEYLLHIWGRPGFTVPMAAVSWMNDVDVAWHAARALSACVSLMAALAAVRLAGQMEIARPHRVVLFCYVQPLYVMLAATTLTENFAALYLTVALCLFMSRRLVVASIVFSLTLVTRHEAAVFLPVWLLALATMPRSTVTGAATASWKRRTAAAAATFWAPLAHNVLFYAVFRRWPVEMFLRPTGSTEYPAVSALSYLPDAAYAATPLILGLALVGGALLVRRGYWLIPALAGAFFATHMLVRALGVFASGGYGRFLVSISPLLAICALAGWDALRQSEHRKRFAGTAPWIALATFWVMMSILVRDARIDGRISLPHPVHTVMEVGGLMLAVLCLSMVFAFRIPALRYIVTAILAATCGAQWLATVRPFVIREDQLVVRRATEYLESGEDADAPIFATSPWFNFYLNLVEHPRAHKGTALLESMPAGTIVFWDSKYSESDFHRVRLAELTPEAGFEPLTSFSTRDFQINRRPLEIHAYRKTVPATVEPDGDDERYYPRDLAAEASPLRGVYYIRPGRPGD